MDNQQIIHEKYYPHIDGIRTIAVMAVVLYHIFGYLCPGGYVGVDVFFVISGYLITGGLLRSLRDGTYSIKDFYTKRIRRIIPAYGVLVVFVLITSVFLYSSSYLNSILTTIGFSSLFSANLYFYQDAGYFAANTELNPLLHLWSLGVEEQFYIFIPLILAYFFKWKHAIIKIIVLMLILSLIGSLLCNYLIIDDFSQYFNNWSHWNLLCAYFNSKKDAFNFFMLPTRAWELLAGSCLAYIGLPRSNKKYYSCLAILGFILFLIPCFGYSSHTLFPGIGAMFPVIVALLLLAYGNTGIVGLILRSKPFVGIGKISYSLYLWHWPLIVFWKYLTDNHYEVVGQIFVLIMSFFMGYLSWKYIEQPIRLRKNWNFSLAFNMTAIMSCFLLAVSIIGIKSTKINSLLGGTSKYSKENYWSSVTPYVSGQSINIPSIMSNLRILGKDEAPKYLLLGDSHAKGLAKGFDEFSKKNKINGLIYMMTVIPGMDIYNSSLPSNDKQICELLDFLQTNDTCQYVILSNFWCRRFESNGVQNRTVNEDNNLATMPEGLKKFCEKVKAMNKTVVIFHQYHTMKKMCFIIGRDQLKLIHQL